MTHVLTYDRDSLKGMEQEDWQRHAAGYDELFGSVTRHAMKPLLHRSHCLRLSASGEVGVLGI